MHELPGLRQAVAPNSLGAEDHPYIPSIDWFTPAPQAKGLSCLLAKAAARIPVMACRCIVNETCRALDVLLATTNYGNMDEINRHVRREGADKIAVEVRQPPQTCSAYGIENEKEPDLSGVLIELGAKRFGVLVENLQRTDGSATFRHRIACA